MLLGRPTADLYFVTPCSSEEYEKRVGGRGRGPHLAIPSHLPLGSRRGARRRRRRSSPPRRRPNADDALLHARFHLMAPRTTLLDALHCQGLHADAYSQVLHTRPYWACQAPASHALTPIRPWHPQTRAICHRFAAAGSRGTSCRQPWKRRHLHGDREKLERMKTAGDGAERRKKRRGDDDMCGPCWPHNILLICMRN